MNRPIPNEKEVQFDFNELFFSTTDLNGLILSFNEVFQRVSSYSGEQLHQAPHNIVRHPDMPRSVFKLFWDTIRSGKCITAYVKNIDANGSYYWVLATVFPVKNGYLSIRMKPSSDLFHTTEAIYQDVLKYEKDHSLDEALNYLISKVTASGFQNYESFMFAALTAEMKAKEASLSDKRSDSSYIHDSSWRNKDSTSNVISRITSAANKTTIEYLKIFNKIDEFRTSEKTLEEKTNFLLDSMQDFELIALNMRVFAALLGNEGASLGIIASNFRDIVADIEKHFRAFDSTLSSLTQMMSKTSLEICFLKLLFDMVDFFTQESIQKIQTDKSSIAQAYSHLNSNAAQFMDLAKKSYQSIYKELDSLHNLISKFTFASKDIKKFINGLEVIAQMGSVESARLTDSGQSFGVYIKRMEEFTEILRNSTSTLVKACNTLSDNRTFITHSVSINMHQFEEIFKLIEEVQNLQSLTDSKKSENTERGNAA